MVDVSLRAIEPTPIAVARRSVTQSEIPAVMIPALDAVWAFVRGRELETGHNVAVYDAGDGSDAGFTAWFGVQVAAAFDGDCSIDCAAMPNGVTAVATHIGLYNRLGETHRAVRAWCQEHGHALSGTSWEIYGDWTDDPTKLETTIGYLLA